MKQAYIKCNKLITLLGVLSLFTFGCKKEEGPPPHPAHNFETGTVTDIEGNTYKTVKIGTQWWMAENLQTTLLNDSAPIPLVRSDSLWCRMTSPAYCWVNDNISTKHFSGLLYNGHAVETGKLAPAGWHVPSDSDWQILITYVGGEYNGIALQKEYESYEEYCGFAATDVQTRNIDGSFGEFNRDAAWWSSDHSNEEANYFLLMPGIYGDEWMVLDTISNTAGLSVRCVKD